MKKGISKNRVKIFKCTCKHVKAMLHQKQENHQNRKVRKLVKDKFDWSILIL